MKNIIFMRVSLTDVKEKQRQDIEQQYKPIISKFNLNPKDCIIIKDKGSAYDMSKFKKRKGFISILSEIVGEDKIKNLFFNKYEKKEINIYVFDYNRLFRNTTYGILFGTLANLYNVKIYSVNQNKDLIINDDDTSTEKSISYLKMALYSQQGEIYSENTSNNTKKAFEDKKGLKVSRYGTLLGNNFNNLSGKKVKLSINKARRLRKKILSLILYYENKKIKYFYDKIINIIQDEFKIIISKSYISKIRNKLSEN